MMYKYLIIYFAIINLLAAAVTCADKSRAKRDMWRIPEKTLWLFGLLGGALGTYVCMKTIRHKTKHKSFMIGMPLLAVLQIALIILYFYLQK